MPLANPLEQVSQRLMVQGGIGGTNTGYKSGLDAFRTIVKGEGVRGLYRGFGASVRYTAVLQMRDC